MEQRTIEDILRVDHSGEFGAIHIYRGQIFVSRFMNNRIVANLEEMLSHEIEHFKIFDSILKKREIRHCYALQFWAFGGLVLGITTALMGKRAVWVCTSAIESTVFTHLVEQIEYLKGKDTEVLEAVLAIKTDEEAHRDHANSQVAKIPFYLYPIKWVITGATEFAIWLSSKL